MMTVVSVHEAGHAIAALQFKLEVRRVEIDLINQYGETYHNCDAPKFRAVGKNSYKDRYNMRLLLENLQIKFAGIIAEKEIFGTIIRDKSYYNDMKSAEKYIKLLSNISNTTEAQVIKGVVQLTNEVIHKNGKKLIVLADILEKNNIIYDVKYSWGKFRYSI